MTPQPNRGEIKREIQATLAARRELGSDYDDHFLDALVEKVARHTPARQAQLPLRPSTLDSGQRLSLAICSLLFGIPLVAISGGIGGLVGLIVVCSAILGINFVASR